VNAGAAVAAVSNPVPTITGLNPSSGTPGGPGFTLTVNGTNFVNGAVVQWNGSNRTTTYVNPTQLTAAITAADIASPATVSVTVRNPDGKTSDAVPFTIAAGRKVYLPLAQKPSLPRAGFWQEYNGAMEFFVTADQRYVDDFAVYVVVDGCEGEYKITKLVPVSISGNSFSFSGAFYASGTFNSTTTASGMAGLSYLDIPGCGTVIGGPWSWQARWVSSAQPAQAEAAVPDGVEPASSQGAFEATRIP
jgi:hypothetical protein